MNKPFEGKDLAAKVLPHAVPAVGATIDWVSESMKMNENPYIKLLAGVVEAAKQPVLDELSKKIAELNAGNVVPQVSAPVAG